MRDTLAPLDARHTLGSCAALMIRLDALKHLPVLGTQVLEPVHVATPVRRRSVDRKLQLRRARWMVLPAVDDRDFIQAVVERHAKLV